MGDQLFDDFDVDALLDAQSSDDDGTDLPELERSLDDILNDTEFADILGGVSSYVKSSGASFRIDNLEEGANLSSSNRFAIGLEGEMVENSRSGLEYGQKKSSIADQTASAAHEGGKTERFSVDNDLNVNSVRQLNSGRTNNRAIGILPTSAGIGNISYGDGQAAASEGTETRETTKRVAAYNHGGWESNGRSSSESAVIDILPQFAKSNYGPRPGDAIAAAAALSRQSGSPRSFTTSRFNKNNYALRKTSSAGTLDNYNDAPETDVNFKKEESSSTSQISDEAVAIQESLDSPLELEAGLDDFQYSSARVTNDGALEFVGNQGASRDESRILWNNDQIHAEAIADLGDEVEILSTLVSQLHEEPAFLSSDETKLSPTREEIEPVPGHSLPMTVTDDSSSDSSLDIIDRGVSAIEIQPDADSSTGALHLPEQAADEAYPVGPELSHEASFNNWIEETQEVGNTSTEATPDERQRAQRLLSRRKSVAARTMQQAIDELEENEPKVREESVDEQILEEKPHPTALQIAEELERNAASSGLHWEEGAVAQPMRLEGIQRGAPAIGLLQLDFGGSLSYALQSSTLRREQGSPQALAVHSNFIAVGLSKGGILVIPSKYSATRIADETDAKHFVLATPGPEKSVSSMCFSQQGDLLLVGYSNGHLVLWDVPKANVIKTLEKEHSVAIVHTLFLGQEIPGARNFKAITSDSKGLTLLHTFTVLPVPVLRRYTVNTTCILDGQRTGIVLSVSPLLPEEGSQNAGGSNTAPHGGSSVPMNLSSVMGVVGGGTGGDVGRKFLYDGAPSSEDSGGGLVVFVTHQVALVVRLLPTVEVCARLSRPEGIREGAVPYTAWRRTKSKAGIPTGTLGAIVPSNTTSTESVPLSAQKDDGRSSESAQSQEAAYAEGMMLKANGDGGENCPSLAIAWDRKILIYQLPKSELKSVAQWEVDSPVVGVAWLEEQMMVVATSKDQLCLFTNEGVEIERAALGTEHGGIGAFIYHTHFMNLYGNPEKAYHNAMAVRGAALYLLGPNQLWRARLLPWKDRIKALENAGDWMGAFHIAMEIFDGRSQGVTGLPKGLDAMREAIMPTLLALLSAYIDEAFAYLSLALGSSSTPQMIRIAPEPIRKHQTQGSTVPEPDDGAETLVQEMVVEARDQYARVGGVAIEFCVHIRKTEVLFENVFSKFEAVGQRGTFLELLEPYILKDMLGGLAPEVMQALVKHYSSRGWLNRVEQCVLHMDIGSLDFNQVVRVCRDHGLYSALIYLFTKGLDDFKSPLEELLTVAQDSTNVAQAKAFGYKLLVYLKYCFTGLAFPPGNGTLSLSRLPKLRAELLGYILDPVETKREGDESIVQNLHPRLQYLLKLDTEGSLSVLGQAFPERGPIGVGIRDWVYFSGSDRPEQSDVNSHLHSQSMDITLPTAEIVTEGVNLAQKTIDAIIHVLQTTNSAGKAAKSELTSIASKEQWPTHQDTGEMLEFVAHFAAGKYAVVTTAIMPHLMEHLTSPAELLENKKLTIQKQREDLMVALLRAVPKSEWDAEQALQLAQDAGYWQVTALLYAQKSDYTAALDSYLKDTTRPQHPFTFMSHMLSSEGDLEGSSLSNFRESVLSRLPELIQLSTVSTLLVVLKHLSNENQRILKELSPHPKLLFNYLKAVMNIRSSGVEPSSSQLELEGDISSTQQSEPGESLDSSRKVTFPGNSKEHSVLDSQGHLADLLQRSGLDFTAEMEETFVELLCQFEPESVLKFLKRYEHYRLEHCLKLCQEYQITDAATFLLERVGDVGSALSLILADVHKSMQEMDQALLQLASTLSWTENYESSAGNEFLDLPEVVAVHSVLHAAVALCQRNTFSLEQQKSESLWFRLLNRFVEPLHNFNKQMKGASRRKQHAKKSEVNDRSEQDRLPREDALVWKVWGNDHASKLLRKALAQFIGDIVNGMMGYVPLPTIMNKILEDHRGHEFGDFKGTILDMLSAYGYERAILGTAKQLIEDDAFQNISKLKRDCSHAFSPADTHCAVCGRGLDEPGPGDARWQAKSTSSTDRVTNNENEDAKLSPSDPSQLGIRIFPCRHATHLSCVDVQSRSESRRSSSVAVCPVCSHIRQPVDLSWHSKNSGLVKGGVIDGRAGISKKSDGIYSSKEGVVYKSTNQVSGYSRLQLLKHLENGTELHELGMPLKLKLAPALSLNKRPNVTGSARLRGTGKSSAATSSRGEIGVLGQRKHRPRLR